MPSPSESSSVPMIGIVAALHLEIAPFLERCRQIRAQSGNGLKYRACTFGDSQVCIVEGGTGADKARQATQALLDGFDPDWILSVGFAGALVDQLKLGDILVADSLIAADATGTLSIDVGMESSPETGLHVGRLCTADHIVREIEEKRQLAERTGALAVDMESLVVARLCRDHVRSTGRRGDRGTGGRGESMSDDANASDARSSTERPKKPTRFMAIRTISDDLSSDLPPEVLALLGPKGTIRAGALVGSLLKRPGSMKDLWALRENAVHASERLADFLEGVLPQLPIVPASG